MRICGKLDLNIYVKYYFQYISKKILKKNEFVIFSQKKNFINNIFFLFATLAILYCFLTDATHTMYGIPDLILILMTLIKINIL